MNPHIYEVYKHLIQLNHTHFDQQGRPVCDWCYRVTVDGVIRDVIIVRDLTQYEAARIFNTNSWEAILLDHQ